MKLKYINQRVHKKHIFVGFVILVLAFSHFLASFAMADQLVESKVTLSSSSAGASDVSYTLEFKAVKSAETIVVDFCSNSPLVGQTCTIPEGMSVSGVSSNTLGFTDTSAKDDNTLISTGSMSENSEVTIELDDITNPTNSGTVYARIVTYDTKANAQNYQPDSIGEGATDTGSVALAITDTINFGGKVPESVMFCMSESAISENCTGVVEPELQLGVETEEDTYVLSSDTVSTDSIHTQLSTNALSGVVVRLTSSAQGCGGLVRLSNTTACDILPALHTDILAGEAKFGIKTTAATETGTNPSGTLQPFAGSGYNNDTFALNYASNEQSGVTSVYGDPFIDTAGAPASNQNMAITFGASVSGSTPAGNYSTKIGLVVTGRY